MADVRYEVGFAIRTPSAVPSGRFLDGAHKFNRQRERGMATWCVAGKTISRSTAFATRKLALWRRVVVVAKAEENEIA